jgi:hypothetical protein
MLLALLLTALAAHPNSISRSRIEVRGAEAEVELLVQAETVVEELGGDQDGDLAYDEAEFAELRPALERYVRERFLLYHGGSPEAGGSVVPGVVEGVELLRDPPASDGFALPGQWIDVRLRCVAPEAFHDLTVVFGLFEVTDSLHLDYSTLWWNDEPAQTFVFSLGARVWRHTTWASERPRVLADGLRRGARGSLAAALFPMFLLALTAAVRRGRGALAALSLAPLGFVLGLWPGALLDLPLPPAFAPLAAALSAAYVASDALLRGAPRPANLEATIFGAVHGLAAGHAAAEEMRAEPFVRLALVATELGAALVLFPLALALYALAARLPGERASPGLPWLLPRTPRRLVGGGVALAALALFSARAGFL